jgi:probable O-glycosylation ligase (exosortase A-associated)
MPLRDIAVTLVVFGLLPLILRRPYVGILTWAWLSYMNPHRLAWGFAVHFPYAEIVALTLFASLFVTKERLRIPMRPVVIVWIIFIAWMGVTTLFALYPDNALHEYTKILKIQLLTFITMMLITDRERIIQLIWVIVVSIGYFGLKGGIFTLVHGGGDRVWGPPGSFISDNNNLALATLMIVPLMEFLRQFSPNPWVKRGLLVAMAFSCLSIVGSQSRGAALALFAVAGFFWLKSRNKLAWALGLVIMLPALLAFMPQEWHSRMSTIDNYEQDQSALGRINAWHYSIAVANARITGAGLESWQRGSFARYAPEPTNVHAAHSIYFGVIADHGWIGFLLWLSIYVMIWFLASWVIRHGREFTDLDWAVRLARMMQVGLLAYATGGAFLSLSYFDLSWHYVSIVVMLAEVTRAQIADRTRAAAKMGAPHSAELPAPHQG